MKLSHLIYENLSVRFCGICLQKSLYGDSNSNEAEIIFFKKKLKNVLITWLFGFGYLFAVSLK